MNEEIKNTKQKLEEDLKKAKQDVAMFGNMSLQAQAIVNYLTDLLTKLDDPK